MILTNLIKSYNIFTEAEVEKIRSAFLPIRFESNSFLLREGEISDRIFFIQEGVLREFSYFEEDSVSDVYSESEVRVITHWILAENEWIYQVESFLLQKPSGCYIQALSPLNAFYIKKQTLEALIKELPALAFVMINIYEKYLLQLEHRNKFHRIKSAEKRLEVFEKMQPNIANHVAGKILASYLNISPEQLSRLRGKRTHKR